MILSREQILAIDVDAKEAWTHQHYKTHTKSSVPSLVDTALAYVSVMEVLDACAADRLAEIKATQEEQSAGGRATAWYNEDIRYLLSALEEARGKGMS